MWWYMWCIAKKIVKPTGLLNLYLVVILMCLWLYWLWSRRNLYRFALTFPGIFGIPLLGTFNRIRGIKYMIPEFGKMFIEQKSYTICIWMGLYPILLTSDPEIVEKILISPDLLNKAKTLYQPLQSVFEGGLVGSPAERWHRNRKLINPSFNHGVLVSFFPIFHKAKNIALSKLGALADGDEHNIAEMLARISLEISVETTMGKIMRKDDMIDEDLCSMYSFMMEKVTVQILLSCLNLQQSFSLYRRFTKTKKYIHNFVNELIKTKLTGSSMECISNNHNNNNDNNYNNDRNNNNDNQNEKSLDKLQTNSQEAVVSMKKTPNIFIDQAIELYHKQEMSWHDIIAESNTIVSAAFETTATTIFSVIVMLAMHSEIQERLFVEILDNFPDKDFEMTYEDFKRLPYLDRVINETLRLLPSVPIIGRQTVKDTQLTKDLNLPKDLQILISIFHLHRRTDIWGPNALKFEPDHFLPENLRDKHSHAFIPFSKGVRNCIGWRYALMAMKTILTGLVRNFRFTTSFKFEDLRYLETITLRYLVEPRIQIQRR